MKCPVCANESFNQTIILKQRLISEWKINNEEVEYINKQQGLICTKCFCNLRSMTLAESIMNHYSFNGQFRQFSYSRFGRRLKLLEINEAGGLHSKFKNFKKHFFAKYPEVDIQKLVYHDNFFDLVVHSDTLEHVPNSLKALQECFRVLKDGGVLFYTIPIIYGRMTISRDKLNSSYHGSQDESQGEDYKVCTEYGADFWIEIVNAGFTKISITTLSDLSSLAISAIKPKKKRYRLKVLVTISFITSKVLIIINRYIFKPNHSIYDSNN